MCVGAVWVLCVCACMNSRVRCVLWMWWQMIAAGGRKKLEEAKELILQDS